MRHDTDIGRAFETLKDWMKQHRKPADKLGMTYEEYKWLVERMNQGAVMDAVLRPLFEAGMWPYAAFKKLESKP